MSVENLNWEGNSKEMYEKLMSSVPPFMQDMAKNGFKEWVEKRNLDTMTEDLLEEHVKETAPPPFVDKILEQLKALKGA